MYFTKRGHECWMNVVGFNEPSEGLVKHLFFFIPEGGENDTV